MKVRTKGRSEAKREAILSAAKQAFHEFGVQNTSMDKLSAMAEVSKRTVYNHFASKEAIVMELLSELWRKAIEDVEIDGLADMDLERQLVALLEHEINVITDAQYIDLAKVAMSHFFFKPDELKEQEAKLSKKDTALFGWLTEQAKSKTLLMQDIELANTQLHSLVKGTAFWPQVLGLKASLSKSEARELAEQTAKLFMSQYRV